MKAEHQRPAGFLQPLSIPEWKWEHITMDFLTGLRRTLGGDNAIWVRLHCKPSGLKCEMTVTPLEWVLGRDRVII